jgi:hypothetical protein
MARPGVRLQAGDDDPRPNASPVFWHIEDGHCGAFGRILRMPDISAYATGSTELGGEDSVRLREAIDTEATATAGAPA